MLSKIPKSALKNDLNTTEEVADLCHNVAKWALQRKQTELAIEWLQRALKMLKMLDTHKSDFDCRRIHLAVLQTLGKSSPRSSGYLDLENEVMADLERNTEAFQSHAMETMEIIHKVGLVKTYLLETNLSYVKRYPREFPVLVLQLEAMLKQGQPNHQDFYEGESIPSYTTAL